MTGRPIDKVLSRLKGVKESGDGYIALCPAHDDKQHSLSVAEGSDGRVLVHCHANAGCETGDIVKAIGLELKDLFPVKKDGSTFKNGANQAGFKPKGSENHKKNTKTKKIVAVYDYLDENGKLLFQAVRFEPKGFAQRRPGENGKYIWSLKGITPVLYHLPEVIAAAAAGKVVYIVEGEKDADNLKALGLTATTCPMGAGKWREHYSDYLKGARVVILPDNDAPGRNHAVNVAASLYGKAAAVKIVELPGVKELGEKADASDWLAAGHTKEELYKSLKETAEWRPGNEDVFGDTGTSTGSGEGGESESLLHLTDIGNADRMVAQHGDDILFCYPWNKWLVWDGKRWKKDDTGEIDRKAEAVVRSIYREAADEQDSAKRAEIVKHARRSESAVKIKAMIDRAKNRRPVLPDAMDKDKWLLNVQNGTIDLRTGELRQHRREDMNCKICPVEYDEKAEAPIWETFLDRVTDGDAELARFMQRAVGYSLTGDTSEHCLFFLYGEGRNGKSKFLDAVEYIMGDYAKSARPDLLMEKQKGDGVPNEVAALAGVRYVPTIETSGGKRLAEALVKQWTGEDTVSARFLYSEFFTFKPQFKIFLAANYKPVIRGHDIAIWERIFLIPFMVYIPPAERDKQLGEKLKKEAAGILRWAVDGCLMWQEEGLSPPDAVKAATEEYRDEMDVLKDFIEDRCVLHDNAKVDNTDIWKEYLDWCNAIGEKFPIGRRTFSQNLERRGLIKKQGRSKYWTGIGLLSERPTLDVYQGGGYGTGRTDKEKNYDPDRTVEGKSILRGGKDESGVAVINDDEVF